MKSSSAGIAVTMILLALVEAPTSDDSSFKNEKKELAGLTNITEVWKQTCAYLDMMVNMSTKAAGAERESVPDEVKKEFGNLLKVFHAMNKRMKDALDAFSRNCTAAMKKSKELQHWRQFMNRAIEKVNLQIFTLCHNVGIEYSFIQSSVERVGKQMDYVNDKCMGISLCLPNSAFTFEKRFFEMLGKMVQGGIPNKYE